MFIMYDVTDVFIDFGLEMRISFLKKIKAKTERMLALFLSASRI